MERNQGESFDAYKSRRAMDNLRTKLALEPKLVFTSKKIIVSDGAPYETKGSTYRNPALDFGKFPRSVRRSLAKAAKKQAIVKLS